MVDQKQFGRTDRKSRSEAPEKAYISDFSLKSDPLGSYTGHPKEKDEKPEQDADDL